MLAHIAREQGDPGRARAGYVASLTMYRELRDLHGEAASRRAIAGLDRDEGNTAKARSGYLAALGLYRKIHDHHGETAVIDDLHNLSQHDR